MPQVEIEILFLMTETDMYYVDNREKYPMLLLSNYYVKANGLQTGKKNEKENVGKRKIKPKII